VMPLDFMWIKLSDDNALPFDVGAASAKVKVNLDVLTQKIGYRVIDAEKFKVDGLAGFRYWHVGTTLTVQSALIDNRFYAPANWVDAVGGARIQGMLSPKLVLTIAGDAGGGRIRTTRWQGSSAGSSRNLPCRVDWRYLSVNYRPIVGATFDATISGLVLGATIPLK